MTPGGTGGPPRVGVWEEMRRRRVPRVTVAYVAAGFAILEAIVFFDLPRGAFRMALGGLARGFPAAVVLAWAFDITDAGVVLTPEDAADDPTYQPGPGWGWAAVASISTLIGLGLHFLG